MKNESKTSNGKLCPVQDILGELRTKSRGGGYIYRGENKCHPSVSSSLYREFDIQDDNFDIELVEKEMLNDAKKHIGKLPQDSRSNFEDPIDIDDLERFTELQHYGGKTNFIDFTADYLIALFFACDGKPKEHGRVILQKSEKIKDWIYLPQNPRLRVVAQKSIFVRPPHGFFSPDEETEVVRIEKDLKQEVLSYLRNYHGISIYTIYNDLHGFITHQDMHGAAYTHFYRGMACQNKADKATSPDNKQNEYKSAIDHYTKAIELNPEYTEAYCSRGIVHFIRDEFPKAIQDYNQAIELNPEYAEAYYSRGKAYYHKGDIHESDIDKAIQDYTQAIKLNPKYAEAYYSRGIVHFIRDEFPKAIQDYNQAIELNPEYTEAYYSRGKVYLNIEEIPEAIQDYNQAIELNPEYTEAYYSRGKAYYHKGDIHESDIDKAIQDYTQAIKLNPKYAEAYYSRGKVYLSREEWGNAEEDLSTAKNMGVGIAARFYNDEESVRAFEAKHEVEVPEDIAVLFKWE